MESFGLDVVETPGFGFSHSYIKASYSMNSSHFLCSVHVVWPILITLISLLVSKALLLRFLID